MERITRRDVDERVSNLNRRLTNGRSIVAQGRNGYIALDEYDASGSAIRTLTVGSARDVGDWLFAAMQGIDLARVPSDAIEAEDEALYTHLKARHVEYPGPCLLRQWCSARAAIDAINGQEPGELITYPTVDGGTYSLPARILAHEWHLDGFLS